MTHSIRLDDLIGRPVRTLGGRRLGRIEECRVVRDRGGWAVQEWVIGSAGLLERLGLSALLLVGVTRGKAYVVRWDQLDVSHPTHPRLTCATDELVRQ